MAERYGIYRCGLCGNLLQSLFDGGGPVTCCGQQPVLLVPNTAEAAKEKHIPVIEKIAGGYRVTVGSVTHPMGEDHYIMWIQLIAGDVCLTRFLKPGEAPAAEFKTDAPKVTVQAYCNLHRLWEAKA